MSGYCIKLPAQQRTSFVAVDTCQPYGLDLLSDWPNPSWAACVILTGVGVVYSLVPAVGGIINRYIIRALDPFITICCAFNTFLFFLVCVIFPAELHNMVGVPAIGEVTACWDGGSYSPGSYCSYASGYGAMWGCFIISLATTGCFGYSAYFVSGSGAFA
ncbi:hypothetical protein SARC_06286 [Sphaeroforma arctica JP610]|uniref:Uncharacterized protein n=1 Tax=Sphaeroforma arctica JP610 TaxID=667725 RepID=A0A0L0FXU3_9EUKA|nr:hypothetical protein SARC_06286 [Sphaeroforma arctica JP610]KNC81381.1 hypothetical protein SARC_06286 [Sphaeroforma arctica JP610]|eukprot:XP_014155283.1 hypothetical protein SARC_06286 [Sphaeroforma arctica JP610]